MRPKFQLLVATGLMVLICAAAVIARENPPKNQQPPRARPSIMQLATDEKSHNVGQLFFTITNYGVFGSQRGDDNPLNCYIYQEGEKAGTCRPSAEYPGGSGIEYLFQGALWVGAVVAGDTLVSVGEDGWFQVNELFPGYEQETDTIQENSSLWDTTAISEQDFTAEFTDTVKNPTYVDAEHRPLGIGIKQRSLSWSYNYARNFIIIDYWFSNVLETSDTIRDVYVGIYVDGDVGHINTDNYAQDDITGFEETYYDAQRDSLIYVNTAWLADNDGDPTEDGRFDDFSCTGALGVAVLKVADIPLEDLSYSFNWWVSNTNEDLDWGPYLQINNFGWDGTPETDKMKYQVMSNREFDYNQTETKNADENYPDYAPPPEDLADKLWGGYDTRFLFSFGPFDIPPDTSIQVGIAVMVAEDFHLDPNNVGMLPPAGSIPSGWDPGKFEYSGVGKTTGWVRDVYNNNYQGPVPPPRPPFEIETFDNKIDIFWKPEICMDYIDEITMLQDFEGFRIYTGQANLESYYTPFVEFDKVDFIDYLTDSSDTTRMGIITRTDEFPICLDARWDEAAEVYRNCLVTPELCRDTIYYIDPVDSTVTDSIFVRQPYGTNSGMPTDSLTRFGEKYYKYTLTNQRAGSDIYIAMTAYDFGQPTRELESLESSKTTNYLWVVPKGKIGAIDEVYVVPNPYRIDHNYAGREGLDWETPVGQVWTEYSRKIRFANLPPRCIVRIYTLDADLVKELHHEDSRIERDGDVVVGDGKDMVGAEDWDLINLNDQAIASGIYMFSVEDLDTGEYQLGKFVIIK
ncbi:hypothetical protein DRQ36_02665 [bacterium]|mgnify:CR=1 FL=1|nr:MAG: hypothetical protein DRQ36_02665 [bacterium]